MLALRDVVGDETDKRVACVQRVVKALIAGPEGHSLTLGQSNVEAIIDSLVMLMSDVECARNEGSGWMQNVGEGQQPLHAGLCLRLGDPAAPHRAQEDTANLRRKKVWRKDHDSFCFPITVQLQRFLRVVLAGQLPFGHHAAIDHQGDYGLGVSQWSNLSSRSCFSSSMISSIPTRSPALAARASSTRANASSRLGFAVSIIVGGHSTRTSTLAPSGRCTFWSRTTVLPFTIPSYT